MNLGTGLSPTSTAKSHLIDKEATLDKKEFGIGVTTKGYSIRNLQDDGYNGSGCCSCSTSCSSFVPPSQPSACTGSGAGMMEVEEDIIL